MSKFKLLPFKLPDSVKRAVQPRAVRISEKPPVLNDRSRNATDVGPPSGSIARARRAVHAFKERLRPRNGLPTNSRSAVAPGGVMHGALHESLVSHTEIQPSVSANNQSRLQKDRAEKPLPPLPKGTPDPLLDDSIRQEFAHYADVITEGEAPKAPKSDLRGLESLPYPVQERLLPLLSGHDIAQLRELSKTSKSSVETATNIQGAEEKTVSTWETIVHRDKEISQIDNLQGFHQLIVRYEGALRNHTMNSGDLHRALTALAARIPDFPQEQRAFARLEVIEAHARIPVKPEDRISFSDVISGQIYGDRLEEAWEREPNSRPASEQKRNTLKLYAAIGAGVRFEAALRTFPGAVKDFGDSGPSSWTFPAIHHAAVSVLLGATTLDQAVREYGFDGSSQLEGEVAAMVTSNHAFIGSIRRKEGPEAAAERLGIQHQAAIARLVDIWNKVHDLSVPEAEMPVRIPGDIWQGMRLGEESQPEFESRAAASLYVENRFRDGATVEEVRRDFSPPIMDPVALYFLRRAHSTIQAEKTAQPNTAAGAG